MSEELLKEIRAFRKEQRLQMELLLTSIAVSSGVNKYKAVKDAIAAVEQMKRQADE